MAVGAGRGRGLVSARGLGLTLTSESLLVADLYFFVRLLCVVVGVGGDACDVGALASSPGRRF